MTLFDDLQVAVLHGHVDILVSLFFILGSYRKERTIGIPLKHRRIDATLTTHRHSIP